MKTPNLTASRALKMSLAPLIIALLMLATVLPAAAPIHAQGGGGLDGGADNPVTPTATPAAPRVPTMDPNAEPIMGENGAQIVYTVAEDGWRLFGDWWLVDPNQPTVILLHQLWTDRASWGVLVGPLLATGRNVLAVDLRGHGATGGAINWLMAVDDMRAWFDWLRFEAGVRGNGISTIGSSMGSALALVGCANDWGCVTAIGISPGWSYYGVDVELAFSRDFGARPALLVYAENDRFPAAGIPLMLNVATNPITVQKYEGFTHGMELFQAEDTLIPLIISWLDSSGG